MPKQDRLSIDLQGLRDRVVAYRSDPAWVQLSLAGKIRTLIEIALNLKPSGRESIATLLKGQWHDFLDAYKGDLTIRQLKDLSDGARPTDLELVELSTALVKDAGEPYSTHELMAIRDRTFPLERLAKENQHQHECR